MEWQHLSLHHLRLPKGLSTDLPILGLPHSTSHIYTVQIHPAISAISVLGFRPRVPVRRFAGSGLAPKTKVFVSAKRFDIFVFCFDFVVSLFFVLFCAYLHAEEVSF